MSFLAFLSRTSGTIEVEKMVSPYLGLVVFLVGVFGLEPLFSSFPLLAKCIFLVGNLETVRFQLHIQNWGLCLASFLGHALVLLPYLGSETTLLQKQVAFSVLLSCLILLYFLDTWPYSSSPVELFVLLLSLLILE